MIRTTLAMNPRRATVFTAKAVAAGITVLVTAAIGAVLVGRPLLSGKGLTADLGYPTLALSAGSLRRAVFGTVLYLLLVALISIGVAAAIRHPGAGIGTMLFNFSGPYLITVLVPMSTSTLHHIQDASPMMAGLSVQTTVAGMGTSSLHPWTGLAVLAAYAAGALLLGGILFRIRDA